MLPEFADAGAFPAALGLGDGKRLLNEVWEMGARVGGNGFAIAAEGEAGSELVGDQLKIRGPLEGQECRKEATDIERPLLMVIAAGDAQGKAGSVMEPGKAEAEKVCAADVEELAGVESAE